MATADRASRQGLLELLIVLAAFALGVAGAFALWGDELRALVGAPAAGAGARR